MPKFRIKYSGLLSVNAKDEKAARSKVLNNAVITLGDWELRIDSVVPFDPGYLERTDGIEYEGEDE